MAAEGRELTTGEYIVHHLTHLHTAQPKGLVDFSVINWDSFVFSSLLAVVTFVFLWRGARRATPGVPGRFQAAVEILVEWVENEAKGIVHNAKSRKMIAPLGLAVFIWVVLLNTMDLLPVDLLPLIWKGIYSAAGHDPEHAYLRVVPTADLSVSMSLAVAVLILSIFYNVKIKGLGGWIHELFVAPFGNHWALWPFNFIMQIVEFIGKTFSHGMRLFGNMYAGELIFLLIALLGGAFTLSLPGFLLAIGQVLAGTGWAIFHILIIVLQAFIFMMLALVYIGQAHETH
jgi:F-type H+-transporting ATPase subunit a